MNQNTEYPDKFLFYSNKITTESKIRIFFSLISTVFWTTLWVLIILLIILRIFVFQQVKVNGRSMEPNYYDGQMLLISKTNQKLDRGQVVAVYANREVAARANYFTPFDPTSVFFLKRAIGLPGESIEIIGSHVIIYNEEFPEGAVLIEDYLSPKVIQEMDKLNTYFPKTKIESNHYFLMGDNRNYSRDSREVGTFPEYSVFGREILRYWPFDQSRVFVLPEYKFKPLDQEIKEKLQQAKSQQYISKL